MIIAWLLSPVGRVVAIAISAIVLLSGLYLSLRASIKDGVIAEKIVKDQERLRDALNAEDYLRRNASDPARLLDNDGHRRD